MKKFVLKDKKVTLPKPVIGRIGKNPSGDYAYSTNRNYEAIWGYEDSLTVNACYGGLTNWIKKKRKDYILHTWGGHDPKFMDYEEIVRRLNRMFKNIFTIRLMRTQDNTVYVLRAKEKPGLKMHIVGKVIAYRLLFVLIRGMNTEYKKNRSNIPAKNLPIKRVWQFVYFFQKNLVNTYGGHGINDKLHTLRNDNDMLKTGCIKFTRTIRNAYGRNFDWNDKNVIKFLDGHGTSNLQQTPAFTVLETLIERFS
jgi:hypothetical protein